VPEANGPSEKGRAVEPGVVWKLCCCEEHRCTPRISGFAYLSILVGALVPSLLHTLALRRTHVAGGVAIAALARALEAIGAPAFVARRDGHIEHANVAGVSLADGAAIDACARLREAIAQHRQGSFVAHLVSPEAPDRFLVVLRDRQDVLDRRLRAAAQDWGATHYEVDVLRWLVTGDSNKEIAVKLRRSEVSVERHITSLLRKAKCDGRARLVARFWNVE
jgi:DNA-binding CsgD family transcriptional regulator